VAKNHNFWQFLIFGGLLYRPPFTNEGQIWYARADPSSTLIGQISSECVHCVGFRWPKTTILAKFWHFWGLLCRPPFTDEGQIWCAVADTLCTFPCDISSRSVYCVVLWRRKTPNFSQFLLFFGLRHLVMSSIVINLTKLSTGAQPQTYPYPMASTSFLYSNALGYRVGTGVPQISSRAHKLWRSKAWRKDRQTNKQTKKLNLLATPPAGEIRATQNLAWW